MKRTRGGYTDSNDDRVAKVQNFIKGLHFSVPLYRLREQTTRRECPKCLKRRQFYCYDCLTVVHPESHPPPLSLPLNVYVILHPNELRGKSTSLAASTISPDLHIVEYPSVPVHLEPASTLVLYPSEQSVELEEVEDIGSYKNVVFIDSTWQQSRGIARDERVHRFKHVRIKSQISLFWRFQNNDPSYLATVEAIYYFLREYVTQVNRRKQIDTVKASKATTEMDRGLRKNIDATEGGVSEIHLQKYYHGEIDDLLFYYINQYIAVQQRYTTGELTKYTDRHFTGYILDNAAWDGLVSPPKDVTQELGKNENRSS